MTGPTVPKAIFAGQHNDHELRYRRYLDTRKPTDAERRKRAFQYLRNRWQNAAPRPNGLKPFSDLWTDISAQRLGIKEDDFWQQVARSIREGFFDNERDLFSVFERKTRITSRSIRETLRWDEDDDWHLLRALVRDSWASIESLSAWAYSQRYEPPRAWQLVSAPVPPDQMLDPPSTVVVDEKRPPATISLPLSPSLTKGEETAMAIRQAINDNERQDGEILKNYHKRISDILKSRSVTASPRTVRLHRERLDKGGRNGRNGKE